MRVYAIPLPGLRVLWPSSSPKGGQALPSDGATVILDAYWRARLSEGAIRIGEAPTDTKGAA